MDFVQEEVEMITKYLIFLEKNAFVIFTSISYIYEILSYTGICSKNNTHTSLYWLNGDQNWADLIGNGTFALHINVTDKLG